MMRQVILSGLMASLAVPGVAVAQHPMVLSKLQELNAKAPQPADEAFKAALAATAKARGDTTKSCIPTSIELGEIAPVTGAAGILQAVMSGQARNAWTVYATHKGCPGSEPVRYMVVQKADGSLLAPQVNEGRTYANPSIMRDTSAGAAIAALQKAKSIDAACTGQDMEMGPTRIATQSKDLGPEQFGSRYVGSWSEVWRFKTCGRSFDVPIDFTPDGDGGAYTNIKGAEVTLVSQD